MKKHGSIKQAIAIAVVSLLFLACIAGFYINRIRDSLITDLKKQCSGNSSFYYNGGGNTDSRSYVNPGKYLLYASK